MMINNNKHNMLRCVVLECSSTTDKRFIRFPIDPNLSEDGMRCCEDHLKDEENTEDQVNLETMKKGNMEIRPGVTSHVVYCKKRQLLPNNSFKNKADIAAESATVSSFRMVTEKYSSTLETSSEIPAEKDEKQYNVTSDVHEKEEVLGDDHKSYTEPLVIKNKAVSVFENFSNRRERDEETKKESTFENFTEAVMKVEKEDGKVPECCSQSLIKKENPPEDKQADYTNIFIKEKQDCALESSQELFINKEMNAFEISTESIIKEDERRRMGNESEIIKSYTKLFHDKGTRNNNNAECNFLNEEYLSNASSSRQSELKGASCMSNRSDHVFLKPQMRPKASRFTKEYVAIQRNSKRKHEIVHKKERRKRRCPNGLNDFIERDAMLLIEKAPKIYLGIPSGSMYILEKLSETYNVPRLDIFMTLKKLKLNSSFESLATDFSLSPTEVCVKIQKTLPFLAKHLAPSYFSYRWDAPPDVFQAKYKNLQFIIDILETSIRNSGFKSPQYKGCSTVKYLLCCLPNGSIAYISQGFPGHSSNTTVYEESRFLYLVKEGAQIMANKNFIHLRYELAFTDSQLIRLPEVVASTARNVKDEMVDAGQLAAIEILERLKRKINEFSILQPPAKIHSSLVEHSNHIMEIICGLVNISLKNLDDA